MKNSYLLIKTHSLSNKKTLYCSLEGVGTAMKIAQPHMETYDEKQVPAFGYELLRHTLLQELLGEEIEPILYWSGRKLARNYPCANSDELILFFEHASWGTLKLINETRDKMKFELGSDLIDARFKNKNEFNYSLENGFLAEQIQNIKGYTADSQIEFKGSRDRKIIFLVAWDPKDPLATEATPLRRTKRKR